MAGSFAVTTSALTLAQNDQMLILWYDTGAVEAHVKKILWDTDAAVTSMRQMAVRLVSSGGSGGTTPTPTDLDSGNDAASYVCRVGATSGGTDAGILFVTGCVADYEIPIVFYFVDPMELILRSDTDPEGVALELLTSPSTEDYGGTITWEEVA